VLAALSKQAGFEVVLGGLKPDERASQKVTVATGKVPFWAAVLKVCDAGGLQVAGTGGFVAPGAMPYVPRPPGKRDGDVLRVAAKPGMAVVLEARDGPKRPASVHGGVLVEAFELPKAAASDKVAAVVLQVWPEPKLAWQSTADVKVTPEAKTCDAPGDGLTLMSDRLATDAQSARARATALDTQIAALGTPPAAGKATTANRIAALQKEASAARAAAARSDEAVDRIKTYRTRHDRGRVIAVLLVVVAIAFIAAAIVLWRRNRIRLRDREESIAILTQKTSEADRALEGRPWRDVVLKGESGILKIGAAQLADGGKGAVIGRSENSADVTFSPADISRQHARMFVREGTLWIVDLGSVGGTTVNNRKVGGESPVSLGNDDIVQLASHHFKVRIQ